MSIAVENIAADEPIPARSRTYSPEVVKKVSDLLNGTDESVSEPVKNLSVGEFEKEGAARSALVTLNRLLAGHGHTQTYAGTVREQENGKFKAILINKPAKKVERKPKPQPQQKRRTRAAA